MRSAPWLLRRLCLGSMLLVGLACSSDDTDADQGSNSDSLTTKWVLPADVLKAGLDATVAFDGPPAWDSGSHCPGALTAGTKSIGDYVKGHFAKVTSLVGYSCRQNTTNAKQTSMHGTGRAIDIMISQIGDKADSVSGDPIANWLVLHAEQIGVQYVVWNHTSWSSAFHEPSDYTGSEPRTDHIHVELNARGAAMQSAWFTGVPSGTGGSAGAAGSGGASGAGTAGKAGSSTAGSGGTSTAGSGGTSAAGKGGAGGTSGAAGTAGKGGSGGTGGTGGTAGKAGSGGTAGAAGKAGSAGTGGCGTVTQGGECKGNLLSYCDSGKLTTVNCSTIGTGQTCGYDSENKVYDCIGDSPSTECGGINGNGLCQGNTLVYCSSDGHLFQTDCTQQGKTCGQNAKSYFECH